MNQAANSPIAWLTAGLFAAALAQVFVAFKLWGLQRDIEKSRKRTEIGLGLEVRRTEPTQPQRAYLRIENASAIGVMVRAINLRATAKGRTSQDSQLALSYAIGPYGSREVEISEFIRNAAVNADPSDPSWQSSGHSADLRFSVDYIVDGGSYTVPGFGWRVVFAGTHFQSVGPIPSEAH